jgi:hypothetical protein
MAAGSQLASLSRQAGAVEQTIRDHPFKALGLGALAGFLVGGGYRSRRGVSLLLLIGRTAMREEAISIVSGAVVKHDGPSGKD